MQGLLEFTSQFATVESCLEYLEATHWANGAFCPHCASSRKVYHYTDGHRHKCADCKRVFRITTGTVFSDSPLKMLPKWFAAIYLVTEHSKDISSVQLSKDIGVTQKTAWHMIQRIQNAVQSIDDGRKLSSEVEIDETYIGGKEKNKYADKRTPGAQSMGSAKTKVVAFSIKERGGDVQIRQVPDAPTKNVPSVVIDNVALDSQLNADESCSYNCLDSFYGLGRINHSVGESVYEGITTNGVESIWTLVNRTYVGTRHCWNLKHTQRCLHRCALRQNAEKGEESITLLSLGMSPLTALPYRELTE